MENIADIPHAYPLLNSRQDNARTLMTVLAIMAFLASLALVFALSAQRLKNNWQDELGKSATIQLMIDNTDTKDLKVDTAVTLLKEEYPKAKVSLIEDGTAKDLLKPWLGSVNLPDDLPVPTLIALELDASNSVSPALLKSKLSDEGIIAEIDDHSRWSNQISTTGRGLLASALSVLALIFLACAAVSAFATQAALSAQRDVIRVLVQVGAADDFITKLFIGQAGKRGLISGFIGVVIGGIISLIANLRRNAETALLPDLTMNWTDIIWLIALMLAIGLICAISAGITSFRLLRQEHRRS